MKTLNLSDIHSFEAIQHAIAAGTLTCQDLVTHYLQVIDEKNPSLNAFLEIYREEAQAKAKEVDEKIKNGTAGKLAGMVVGLKDVLCHQNHGLQASSKMLDGFESQFNGTAVERLLKEDAIIIGRQNCDEFAMGSSNENSAFGVVKNAIGENRVPGGSSGGSAVSVQAGMCLVSLGSDTGGSVRQPAAFCGIVGLKPTYSRISRYGLIAFASSFDTIGIFANNAADVATTLEVIAGKDDFDSTVSQSEVPAYTQLLKENTSPKPKVAYIKETLHSEGLSEEIKQKTLEKIDWLKNNGYEVEEVDFPLLKYALPTYYILITAEASTNLSRYDGVRYGYRSPNVTDLESMYKKTRTEGFGKEVKRRIMLGTFVLSASYYDAYFTKAQKVRRKIQEAMKDLFQKYDFIISPTTPTTAFEIGKYEGETVELYLADLFTVPASVVGIPAISIPNGEDSNGLPIGLQIMGDYFSEAKLLKFSDELMIQNKTVKVPKQLPNNKQKNPTWVNVFNKKTKKVKTDSIQRFITTHLVSETTKFNFKQKEVYIDKEEIVLYYSNEHYKLIFVLKNKSNTDSYIDFKNFSKKDDESNTDLNKKLLVKSLMISEVSKKMLQSIIKEII